MPRSELGPPRAPAVRLSLALASLLILAFFTWNSARYGYAAWLTAKAASTSNLAAANTAVSLKPGNADAQLLLGGLLEAYEDRSGAIRHYQTATTLRPQDYVLWLQLARAQELEGDSAAAITSARNAVSLAPFYSQPHWQLGNMLVRAGHLEDGFSELRLAGASDSALLPAIVDLAWQLSGEKIDDVKQKIQPNTKDAYKALAEYFKRRGQWAEAVTMFEAGGSATEQERRAYITELISAKRFLLAHALWSVGRHVEPSRGLVFDSGFEGESDLDEPGFGWRATSGSSSLTLSLDNSNPRQGRSSLRVDFNGESNPNAPVISQLVLLEPKTNYQLRVALRSEGLVSGGLPTILIVDPNDNKVLGQTGALPQTTDGWRETTIAFATGDSTTAIQIALQREPCSKQQCPIFGRLWLDDFFLRGPNYVGEG